MSCDALAKALEAAPELLAQAVVAGRIECVVGLVLVALFLGCGIYAFRLSRNLEKEPKAMAIGATAVCVLFVLILSIMVTEGLAKSFLAPNAYAVEQLLR